MKTIDYALKKINEMNQKAMESITENQVKAFLNAHPEYFVQQIKEGRFKGCYALFTKEREAEVFDSRYFHFPEDAIKDAILILQAD